MSHILIKWILVLLCNIFLINVVTSIRLKEEFEKNNEIIKDENWDLVEVSLKTIVVLLVFQIKFGVFVISINIFSMVITCLIFARIDLKNILTISLINKKVSEKIMYYGTRLFIIWLLGLILLKYLQ